ncbi:hypothetical protein [Pseudomonas mangrovi]|jgi:F0F1-type ATP synthase membrane subunit b/b'|uniref:Lipoprotein n=1 Tax=Pseudomonas mangrovi TaxID=2161748 RepID=A0A2T5P7B2_9PSED|nr:hypothetical protein [Pseudomonas mangrovi]PTU73594.1 hypothetical protein DBO85_14870 [Pseudomonas mangrovi]
MNKAWFYIALLGGTLGLSACEKSPEQKMEDARESAADAVDSMGDAARSSGEAARDKLNEE